MSTKISAFMFFHLNVEPVSRRRWGIGSQLQSKVGGRYALLKCFQADDSEASSSANAEYENENDDEHGFDFSNWK